MTTAYRKDVDKAMRHARWSSYVWFFLTSFGSSFLYRRWNFFLGAAAELASFALIPILYGALSETDEKGSERKYDPWILSATSIVSMVTGWMTMKYLYPAVERIYLSLMVIGMATALAYFIWASRRMKIWLD